MLKDLSALHDVPVHIETQISDGRMHAIGQRPAANNVMPARHLMLSSGEAEPNQLSVGLPGRLSAYAVQ